MNQLSTLSLVCSWIATFHIITDHYPPACLILMLLESLHLLPSLLGQQLNEWDLRRNHNSKLMSNTLGNSPNIMAAMEKSVRVLPAEELVANPADNRLASDQMKKKTTVPSSMMIFRLLKKISRRASSRRKARSTDGLRI